MTEFLSKNRKRIFIGIILCTYICIFAYNYLTPYLSDDYAYLMELRDEGGNSLLGALKLAYNEYFMHGGRLVHYATFRIFLVLGNKQIFNIVSSAYFVVLGILIYLNISRKRKYDLGTLIFIYLMLWLFMVRPGQTVTWLTGAVVYLFAIVYILASVTAFRYLTGKSEIKHPIWASIGMFVLCLVAGNVSENNSGAGLLIIIILSVSALIKCRQTNAKFFKPYIITTYLGYFIGYALLILSPGSHSRVAATNDDEYTGIVALVSHIYKVTMAVKELFLPLLIVVVILVTVLVIAGRFRKFTDIISNPAILYLIGFMGGCYALIVISLPEYRAFFGDSVFLIIAIIELFTQVSETGRECDIIRYCAISVLCLVFTFDYLDNLVDLSRVNREKNEQFMIIEQERDAGNTQYIEIPMLHEEFDNRFTIAYYPQLNEDPDNWLNTFYEGWFGVDKIKAIPREVWDETH